MNRLRLNLIDLNFSGEPCACHGKRPRIIEWDRDEVDPGRPTVFTDFTIGVAAQLPPGDNNYAWLLESPLTNGGVIGRKNLALVGLAHFAAVFTSERELVERNPAKFRYAPVGGIWVEPAIYPKTKLVSMIASDKSFTRMQHARTQIAQAARGSKVDVFGRGTRPIKRKEEALGDYMFSIAIENAATEGYWTEKLLDCFATGTVPIYWGAPDIRRYFDDRGIIRWPGAWTTDRSERTLAAVLEEISPARYAAMKPYIIANYHEALRYEIPDDRLAVDHFGQLIA